MKSPVISNVVAREILDSRGNPTVEVDVELSCGAVGTAAVPSGASVGQLEAVELRDGDDQRYHGKGVLKAVNNVNTVIREALINKKAIEQINIDQILIDLDGTENKGRIGANAILGTSLAVAKAMANSIGISLFHYVGGVSSRVMPVPMMNIINGGAHADNLMDFQEFMIVPTGASSFVEAVRMGSEVFHTLRKSLTENEQNTNVGDEGGFAPNLSRAEEALDYIVSAIEASGYKPGTDICIALDPASSEFYQDGAYVYSGESLTRTIEEQVDYLEQLVNTYPIISIEDGMAEDDFKGWKLLTDRIGQRCQLVGDDIFVTNVKELKKGIDSGLGNSILIKVNQIGSLTEMLDTVRLATKHGYTSVMSHRSGETEDTTISDLAVATNCGQIKTGSLSRSDRTSKYNQLIRIEEKLGSQAIYPGISAFISN